MIRIRKPSQVPRILRERGKTTPDANCSAFDGSSGDYLNGSKKFDFVSSIYGAKSVKKALVKAQQQKCCFCESKVTHIAKASASTEWNDPLTWDAQLVPDSVPGKDAIVEIPYGETVTVTSKAILRVQNHKQNPPRSLINNSAW